ncbi:MAG: ribonuclease P protein subunit [Candidatus Woesearchaeota archaeon]
MVEGKLEAFRDEIIGCEIMVVDALNKSLVGIRGKAIDETKNTITVETASGIKKILKAQVKIELDAGGKKIMIEGKSLAKRPEERIKVN